jgi:hypothetical protein
MAAGLSVLSTLGMTASYWHFLAGLLPFGAGMALSGAPATTAIVASLPPDKQGVASAMNDVSRELGGALGIAVLGSVLNSAYRASIEQYAAKLPHDLGADARASIGAAQAIGRRLGSPDLVSHASAAFAHGVSVALIAGAGTLIGGAVFVAIRAPGRDESAANAGTQAVPSLSPSR